MKAKDIPNLTIKQYIHYQGIQTEIILEKK